MSIRISDCTIRDGGYLLQKNVAPKYVRGIMDGLVKAGIDFVETGFLQTKSNGESLVFSNASDAKRYIPEQKGNTEFLGFCDNSRYSPDLLEPYDGSSFRWLRISFAKHEIEESLHFCQVVQEKGYLVQFNPMDSISYSDAERASLIERVNQIKPGAMSIVDTFGAMYMEDLQHIFAQMNALLDKDIAIGLHSHDNLGLSTALAEMMIMLADDSGRDVIVDGSLLGMGRGAGNASTELLAVYINEHKGGSYNIPALLETIQTFVSPIKDKVSWGYDLPMFICGALHSHVDNVYYLQNNTQCTDREMYEILKQTPLSTRTRYGKGYSKTDFSVLERAYQDIVKRR